MKHANHQSHSIIQYNGSVKPCEIHVLSMHVFIKSDKEANGSLISVLTIMVILPSHPDSSKTCEQNASKFDIQSVNVLSFQLNTAH
jgi:hypothetical protein